MSNFAPSVLDVTKPDFDADAYVSSKLKEKSLDELVKEEEEMVSAALRLDSEMHQLVYENYNKFLTATNTVRTMQDEFVLLDKEMSSLSTNMKNISGLINELSGVLGPPREDIVQLGSSYKVLKSLQFIFDLPSVLRNHLEERRFSDFARLHRLSQNALKKYNDIDNVSEINMKISQLREAAVNELLKSIAASNGIENLKETAELLLQMDVPSDKVKGAVLASAESCLTKDLENLQKDPADVLDLVDRGCGGCIPNVALFASVYMLLFPSDTVELLKLLEGKLNEFHDIVSAAFLEANDAKDCSIVVRALDRYFRKMSTCKHVAPGLDCHKSTIDLIHQVSEHELEVFKRRISAEMKNAVNETRQSLLSQSVDQLPDLCSKLEQAFVYHVKTALANLLLFTASDVTFSTLPTSEFQAQFASNVYERLAVAAFRDLVTLAETYDANGENYSSNPMLLLIIAVAIHNLASKSVQYLLNLCKEQFSLTQKSGLPHANEVSEEMKHTSQNLIRSFALRQGLQIGENLIKGYHSFANTAVAPTGVRAAIRRAVDEVNDCENILSKLFGGDQRRENRTRRAAETPRDSLWCERVDFHQQIHFNKPSIVSAVVKVMLKSLIESIRLESFSRSAVEQIQVDCCFLQRQLGPLVADEVALNSLVDQALSSALKRCLDPQLIHPSKLAQLCGEKM